MIRIFHGFLQKSNSAKFIVKSTGTVLCFVMLWLIWSKSATSKNGSMLWGIYSVGVFLVNLTVSYALAWLLYFIFARKSFTEKLMNFSVTTVSVVFCLALFELGGLLNLVDYGRLFATQTNLLDRELLHIHHPGEKIVGEFAGNMYVTDRRYPVDIQYDSRGFRNPRDIERAPIALIGDSFIESVLVPQTELLSTRLSQELGVEVANLGQSAYGPQQELVVLKRYGLALQPEVVVWFFFEGNDLYNISGYEREAKAWHRLKIPIDRSFTKNSLLKIATLTQPKAQTQPNRAHRISGKFTEYRNTTEHTLYFAHPGAPLSAKELRWLDKTQRICLEAKRLSLENGAKFLFVFVPMKYRVYSELCQFPPDGDCNDWQLNDLPLILKQWCSTNQIAFLDLTPTLQQAAQAGHLVYFSDDTHWNSAGHEVATTALVRYMRERLPNLKLSKPATFSTDSSNDKDSPSTGKS